MKLSNEVFISVTVLISSQISFWLFFIISVSLIIFSTCYYVVFLVSFASLSIVKTVDLMCYGQFLLISFLNGHTLVIPFHTLHKFLLKIEQFEYYNVTTLELVFFPFQCLFYCWPQAVGFLFRCFSKLFLLSLYSLLSDS